MKNKKMKRTIASIVLATSILTVTPFATAMYAADNKPVAESKVVLISNEEDGVIIEAMNESPVAPTFNPDKVFQNLRAMNYGSKK